MKFKVTFLFLLFSLVSCMNNQRGHSVMASVGSVGASAQDQVVEEINSTSSAQLRNFRIQEAVREGRIKKADTYIHILPQVGRRFATNVPETFRVLAHGFIELSDEEVTLSRMEQYLSLVPRGYRTRSAEIFFSSEKMSPEARKALKCYLDDMDPCPSSD